MLPTGPSFQRTCQIEDDGWLSRRVGSFLSTEGMLGVAAPFSTNGSKAASCAADKMAKPSHYPTGHPSPSCHSRTSVATASRNILPMAWWRKSSPPCHGCAGSSSSRGTRASLTGEGRRREARGARAWGALCPRRQCSKGRQPRADYGAAYRHVYRSPFVGSRFDGALEDIFDLQDQETASVVGAISPKLEQAEIERTRRKPTENLDAYDYYLRGLAGFHQWTKEGIGSFLKAGEGGFYHF
jgi:hypothetical protein